jgi:methyl-accepting chemotaxis protein
MGVWQRFSGFHQGASTMATQQQGKGGKTGISFKLTAIAVSTVLLSVGITTATVLYILSGDLMRQVSTLQDSKLRMLNEFVTKRGQLKLVNGQLMAGDYIVNGNYDIVDRLHEISGGVATIFMNDVRVSTNILKEDGTRAIGTKLQGPAREAVMVRGESYRGEADILGVPYFTAYEPIKDHNGASVGVYFVGVKRSDFYQSINLSVVLAVVMGLVFAGLAAVLVLVSVRGMMKDITQLAGAAESMSVGAVINNPIELSRKDEIGALAVSLEALRKASQSRPASGRTG